jgi:single-stranded DNA-binding protein
MIEGLIAGKLVGVAEMREGKNGSSFALAKVKASAGDGESLIVNVIAFAAEASAALMALDDGDALALSGALTPKVWTDKQGNTRPALDLIATQVLSAYHVNRKRMEHGFSADSNEPNAEDGGNR